MEDEEQMANAPWMRGKDMSECCQTDNVQRREEPPIRRKRPKPKISLINEALYNYPALLPVVSLRIISSTILWLLIGRAVYIFYWYYIGDLNLAAKIPLSLLLFSFEVGLTVVIINSLLITCVNRVMPLEENSKLNAFRPADSLLVTSIIVGIAVLFGSIFFLMPGLFLLITLFFGPALVVEDEMRPLAALNYSYSVFNQNWVKILPPMTLSLFLTISPVLTTPLILYVLKMNIDFFNFFIILVPYFILWPFSFGLLAIIYREYYK